MTLLESGVSCCEGKDDTEFSKGLFRAGFFQDCASVFDNAKLIRGF
jgi:hypothetical protein